MLQPVQIQDFKAALRRSPSPDLRPARRPSLTPLPPRRTRVFLAPPSHLSTNPQPTPDQIQRHVAFAAACGRAAHREVFMRAMVSSALEARRRREKEVLKMVETLGNPNTIKEEDESEVKAAVVMQDDSVDDTPIAEVIKQGMWDGGDSLALSSRCSVSKMVATRRRNARARPYPLPLVAESQVVTYVSQPGAGASPTRPSPLDLARRRSSLPLNYTHRSFRTSRGSLGNSYARTSTPNFEVELELSQSTLSIAEPLSL